MARLFLNDTHETARVIDLKLQITNYWLSIYMGHEFQSARIIKYDAVSLYCVTMASTLIGIF